MTPRNSGIADHEVIAWRAADGKLVQPPSQKRRTSSQPGRGGDYLVWASGYERSRCAGRDHALAFDLVDVVRRNGGIIFFDVARTFMHASFEATRIAQVARQQQ